MLLDGEITDASGEKYSRDEAMALTLISIACDKKHKQCIQAQRLIYELTDQLRNSDDKKKSKLILKQLEKDIELTQKKIENAEVW